MFVAAFLGVFLHVVSATDWIPISHPVLAVDIGPAGVWIIRPGKKVFARKTVWPVPKDTDEPWVEVPGEPMVQLGVGRDIVWAMNEEGKLFFREGISGDKPVGTGWKEIGGRFRQFSVDANSDLVLITKDGRIFKCDKTTPATASYPTCETLPKPPSQPLKYVTVGETSPVNIWGVDERDHVYRLLQGSGRYFWKPFPWKETGLVAAPGGVYIWGPKEPLKFVTHKDGRFVRLGTRRGLQQVAAYGDVVYILYYHQLLAQRRSMFSGAK